MDRLSFLLMSPFPNILPILLISKWLKRIYPLPLELKRMFRLNKFKNNNWEANFKIKFLSKQCNLNKWCPNKEWCHNNKFNRFNSKLSLNNNSKDLKEYPWTVNSFLSTKERWHYKIIWLCLCNMNMLLNSMDSTNINTKQDSRKNKILQLLLMFKLLHRDQLPNLKLTKQPKNIMPKWQLLMKESSIMLEVITKPIELLPLKMLILRPKQLKRLMC